MINLRKGAFMAVACTLLAIPAFASADFNWDFNTVITGDTPGGPAPWANLTGTQNGSDVNFVLTFNDFTGAGDATEFLKQLDLAYAGTIDGTQNLVTSDASITGFDVNDFVDAGIHFNVMMDFETAHSGDRVTPGESVDFTITNVDSLDFTTGLLHINGTPGLEGSGKVSPVPEPASMAALSMGAIGLLARRRRARK